MTDFNRNFATGFHNIELKFFKMRFVSALHCLQSRSEGGPAHHHYVILQYLLPFLFHAFRDATVGAEQQRSSPNDASDSITKGIE